MDELRNSAGRMAVAESLERSSVPDNGSIEPFQRQPISAPEIEAAYQTLMKYKEGKANLERRIVENQQWYKLRQWESMRRQNKAPNQVEPVSAWLLNSITNKHAEVMDNFPRANILPREEGDKEEAKRLSSIIPVVLDQCEFEGTYSAVMDDKIPSGTGVYGVFWDPARHNGLGDIDIKAVDLVNLYWQSGITDIQKSRNVFYVTLQDNDLLIQDYPQLENKLGNPTIDVTKYVYDDTIDTTDQSAVVDWYYKKKQGDKTVLHYCKFVAGVPEALFATENDEMYADSGWYDHGLYPFIFDVLMPCKGTPCGFGYIDIGKSAQEYIDRGDKAILENMLFNARPRHFIRSNGGVNEAEFADATKDFVHVEGSLGDENVRYINGNPLNDIYVSILTNKIQELKETTGNRDVTNGGTTGGATAASAIAAMQEAGSRLARDISKSSYRTYRKVILMVIELIRQFYDVPRMFRILGENGQEEFTSFSNEGLLPQPQGTIVNGVPMEMGIEVGYRLPVFDIEVTAEKASPYTRMAQNELALQFYGAGFFAPNNADAALACLDMMDFDRKDFVIQKIQQNGTLYEMLVQTQQLAMQLAGAVDMANGTNMTGQLQAQFAGAGQQMQAMGIQPKISAENKESSITANARERVANSTAPR